MLWIKVGAIWRSVLHLPFDLPPVVVRRMRLVVRVELEESRSDIWFSSSTRTIGKASCHSLVDGSCVVKVLFDLGVEFLFSFWCFDLSDDDYMTI